MTEEQEVAYWEGVRAKFEGAKFHHYCFQVSETECIEYWKKGWSDQAAAQAKNESLY